VVVRVVAFLGWSRSWGGRVLGVVAFLGWSRSWGSRILRVVAFLTKTTSTVVYISG
jgi:hypothetical protein